MTNATIDVAAASTAAQPGQVWALAALFLIIVAAGVIGGGAAYLAGPKPGGTEAKSAAPRFFLLGVVAAACVPLFLSLTQSGLLVKILNGGGTAGALEGYLIFIGLCLVAAFSSRRFIDTISRQLLQRIEEVDEKARGAVETAEDAKATAAEAQVTSNEVWRDVEAADRKDAEELEADPAIIPFAGSPEAVEAGEPVPLSAEERAALDAMTNHPYRTMSGVAEASGVSRSRISELLEQLAQTGLAEPTTSPRTGGLRWRITLRGLAALRGRS